MTAEQKKIYKLWQQGMNQYKIADKLQVGRKLVQQTIANSPRMRFCMQCGKEFLYDCANKKFCSRKCTVENRGLSGSKSNNDLSAVTELARKQGLSYGKMQAKDVCLDFRKRDCFAYDDGRCTALICLLCAKRRCRFYKPKAEYEADLEKYKRI